MRRVVRVQEELIMVVMRETVHQNGERTKSPFILMIG